MVAKARLKSAAGKATLLSLDAKRGLFDFKDTHKSVADKETLLSVASKACPFGLLATLSSATAKVLKCFLNSKVTGLLATLKVWPFIKGHTFSLHRPHFSRVVVDIQWCSAATISGPYNS